MSRSLPRSRPLLAALLALLALEAGMAAGPIGGAPPPVGTAGDGASEVAPASEAEPAPAPVPASFAGASLVPVDRHHLQPVLVHAAVEQGVPVDLVLAMAWAESSWHVDAVSYAGAMGIMQLMPATVDFVSRGLLGLDGHLDAFDPSANARMGTRFMRHLLERTNGDVRQALIAYNQGLTALLRNGPYPAAVVYADRVLALRAHFGGQA